MREKTIKQVLRKKVDDWVKHLPEDLQKVVNENVIITGGCIVSLMENNPPNDFDVYFKTKESAKKVAKYYVDLFNKSHGPIDSKIGFDTRAIVLDGEDIEVSEGEIKILNPELATLLKGSSFKNDDNTNGKFSGMSRMIANTPKDRLKIYIQSKGLDAESPESMRDNNYYMNTDEVVEGLDEISSDDIDKVDTGDKTPYRPVFLSSNAVSLSDKIQIIVRFYGDPSQVHDTFDFVHTKGYWDCATGDLVIPKEVYESVMNKVLIYTGSRYPVATLFRMRKFINRGWKINAGQIFKVAHQISQLNLNNIDVLEDQLIGVDSLYFMHLIDSLRSKRLSDPNFNIDTVYVMSIIDKMFG